MPYRQNIVAYCACFFILISSTGQAATFDPTYAPDGAWTGEMRACAERSINGILKHIQSNIEFKIYMEFTDLGNVSTIGYGSPADYKLLYNNYDGYTNYLWKNVPRPHYAVLANDPSVAPDGEHKDYHMAFTLNSNPCHKLYWGEESINTKDLNLTDMQTTIQHELMHCLGFVSLVRPYGYSGGYPTEYDYQLGAFWFDRSYPPVCMWEDRPALFQSMEPYPPVVPASVQSEYIYDNPVFTTEHCLIYWCGRYTGQAMLPYAQQLAGSSTLLENNDSLMQSRLPYEQATYIGIINMYTHIRSFEDFDPGTHFSHWAKVFGNENYYLLMAPADVSKTAHRSLDISLAALKDLGYPITGNSMAGQKIEWNLPTGQKSLDTAMANISNPTGSTMRLLSLGLTGTNSSDFQIGDSLLSLPCDIPPYGFFFVPLSFFPATNGLKNAIVKYEFVQDGAFRQGYVRLRGLATPGSDTDADGLSDLQETMDLDPTQSGTQNPFDPNAYDSTGDSLGAARDGVEDGSNDWDNDGIDNRECKLPLG